MIESSIFKSYDVRGVYPSQLCENTAYQIGKAFIKHTNAKRVVVGYDARISSPNLFRALAEGIISQGANVFSIGQVPSECLYFAVGNYDFDGGIMITASHNPKEYNGLKMMTKGKEHIEWIRGKDLLPAVESAEYQSTDINIEEKDILPDYINQVFSLVNVNNMKPFTVAIDASNGVMGKVIEKLQSKLPINILPLNFTPDGNFPNHSPNPLEEGSINQIRREIVENKASVGFIFDGDADRIFMVDETGALVSADAARLMLAKHFLTKNPGAVIVHDTICSRAVPELIAKWGGVPVKSEVGFVNIREALIKHNGVMGGELSSHYCFRDFFFMDSGLIAFLVLLEIISFDDRKVSEAVRSLTLYAKAPTINFEVGNKDEVLAKIKEKYRDGKQDFLDGITVEYDNWWFNVRPSNTEPLLRLTIEADTRDLLEEKKKELSDLYFKLP